MITFQLPRVYHGEQILIPITKLQRLNIYFNLVLRMNITFIMFCQWVGVKKFNDSLFPFSFVSVLVWYFISIIRKTEQRANLSCSYLNFYRKVLQSLRALHVDSNWSRTLFIALVQLYKSSETRSVTLKELHYSLASPQNGVFLLVQITKTSLLYCHGSCTFSPC